MEAFCAALVRAVDCELAFAAMAALASAYEKFPAEGEAAPGTGVDAPDIGLDVRCRLAADSMCAMLRTSHESFDTVRRRAPLGWWLADDGDGDAPCGVDEGEGEGEGAAAAATGVVAAWAAAAAAAPEPLRCA